MKIYLNVYTYNCGIFTKLQKTTGKTTIFFRFVVDFPPCLCGKLQKLQKLQKKIHLCVQTHVTHTLTYVYMYIVYLCSYCSNITRTRINRGFEPTTKKNHVCSNCSFL